MSENEEMEETSPLETSEEIPNKGKNISIYLSNDLIKKTEKYAEQKGVKRSQVVAEALESHISEREQRIFDKLNRIELTQKKILKQISNPPLEKEKKIDPEILKETIKKCTSFFDGFNPSKFAKIARERKWIGNEIWTDEAISILKGSEDSEQAGEWEVLEEEEGIEKLAKNLEIDPSRFKERKTEGASEEEEEEW